MPHTITKIGFLLLFIMSRSSRSLFTWCQASEFETWSVHSTHSTSRWTHISNIFNLRCAYFHFPWLNLVKNCEIHLAFEVISYVDVETYIEYKISHFWNSFLAISMRTVIYISGFRLSLIQLPKYLNFDYLKLYLNIKVCIAVSI